ncbi:hypothetical protein FACS1894187_03990 [Synergistales bacterium]|nr:hypothetical protein FACS1894187_03990 [Synergistales bacterium]
MKNYYETLGVLPTISSRGLKTRFRQMMLEFHPDVAQNSDNADERYGEIMEAYRTLIDKGSRAAYDFSNGFPGPESIFQTRRAKQEASASQHKEPEMALEERKAQLKKLLAEKRAMEEKKGFFSFGGYFERIKLWVVFIVLAIVIPAISVALEFFHYLNTSTRKLDIEKAAALSAGVTLGILGAFLILRAVMLPFKYRPSKSVLWGLSFIGSSAYAYAIFFLGENFGYQSYFSSTLIDRDSVIGVAIFTLVFAAGLFSVENKNMFGK